MIRGLYSAATALDTAQQNHDVVAQNLAHLNVPGYRRRGLAFETFDQAVSQAGVGVNGFGTSVSKSYSGFEPGPIQFTGNSLDVALDGDSFFVLQGNSGPLYTRNGVFKMSADGQLQSREGLPVLGLTGPIAIPADAGEIVIRPDGTLAAGQSDLGQLQLARFPNPNVLLPVGTTLFQAPADVAAQPGTSKALQRYREGANTEAVNEMVSMITGMRQFEAAQRALRAINESVQLNTRPQAA